MCSYYIGIHITDIFMHLFMCTMYERSIIVSLLAILDAIIYYMQCRKVLKLSLQFMSNKHVSYFNISNCELNNSNKKKRKEKYFRFVINRFA